MDTRAGLHGPAPASGQVTGPGARIRVYGSGPSGAEDQVVTVTLSAAMRRATADRERRMQAAVAWSVAPQAVTDHAGARLAAARAHSRRERLDRATPR
jgi:hypothetical protein